MYVNNILIPYLRTITTKPGAVFFKNWAVIETFEFTFVKILSEQVLISILQYTRGSSTFAIHPKFSFVGYVEPAGVVDRVGNQSVVFEQIKSSQRQYLAFQNCLPDCSCVANFAQVIGVCVNTFYSGK